VKKYFGNFLFAPPNCFASYGYGHNITSRFQGDGELVTQDPNGNRTGISFQQLSIISEALMKFMRMEILCMHNLHIVEKWRALDCLANARDEITKYTNFF